MVKVEISKLKPSKEKAGINFITAIDSIMPSIRVKGLQKPILVDKDFNIIDGNVRFYALVELGKKEVDIEFK